MNRSKLLFATLLAAAAPLAHAATPTIAAAVADPGRPAADTARDADRKPAEMLAFAGIRPGMVVMDIMPGGGYFTRLFSVAVGPTGKVIAYVPAEVAAKFTKSLPSAQAVAAEPGRSNVMVAHDALMDVPPDNFLDVAWTAQNYHDLHNLPGFDGVAYDRLVYKALKPGGTYVVLDHAAAAGSGLSATDTLHRIDPAVVRREVEAAGFTYDGASTVLANRADDHTLKIFDPAIRGHTDQFVYRFRKPK